MKQIRKIVVVLLAAVSFQSCAGTIRNAKTEVVKVAGNCDMCEAVIEKAVNRKGVAEGDWDATTKQLKLTYDQEKITKDELLKKVAYSGYDNEQYLAPDEAYNQLPACCHYDRMKKTTETTAVTEERETVEPETAQVVTEKAYALEELLPAYFSLKDALIAGNASNAASKANELLKTIQNVSTTDMEASEKTSWEKLYPTLLTQTQKLANSKELEVQRTAFMGVSQSVYELIQVFGSTTTIYLQHCPMYNDGNGADWLSKENLVKNPYYGSSMLTCGKTIKTINKTP